MLKLMSDILKVLRQHLQVETNHEYDETSSEGVETHTTWSLQGNGKGKMFVRSVSFPDLMYYNLLYVYLITID